MRRGARPQPDPDAAGFTLLEILVVLTILGVLVVGLTQCLRLGIQFWDREARTVDGVSELDAAARTLRGLIEQLDPGGKGDMPRIAGTSRWLRFTTEMPAAAGALPTRRAEVTVLVDAMHRLLLRWRPSPHTEPFKPVHSVDTVLLSDVDHIDMSYQSPAGGWLPDWDGSSAPLLVRIHIAFAPNDPRRWPDIVAAPVRERGGT